MAEPNPPPDGQPDMDEMLVEEEHPRGTLFLMLVFLMAIVGMWGYIYLIMLERGGT